MRVRGGRMLLVGLALLTATTTAQAGRWGFGFYVGGPCCYRPWWGPAVIIRPAPVYLAPAPVYVTPAPVVAVSGSVDPNIPPPPPPPAQPAPAAPSTLPAPVLRGA